MDNYGKMKKTLIEMKDVLEKRWGFMYKQIESSKPPERDDVANVINNYVEIVALIGSYTNHFETESPFGFGELNLEDCNKEES